MKAFVHLKLTYLYCCVCNMYVQTLTHIQAQETGIMLRLYSPTFYSLIYQQCFSQWAYFLLFCHSSSPVSFFQTLDIRSGTSSPGDRPIYLQVSNSRWWLCIRLLLYWITASIVRDLWPSPHFVSKTWGWSQRAYILVAECLAIADSGYQHPQAVKKEIGHPARCPQTQKGTHKSL